MKTQLTTNPERDLLKNLKKQKYPEFMNEAISEENREVEEPQEPTDLPQEKNPHKRKPAWVREAIQGAERYGAPEEMHREEKNQVLLRLCSPTM